MPPKARWALNPKKWFGHITNSPNKRDRNNPMPRAPPTATTTTRTIPAPSTTSSILTTKNKPKVISTSSSSDINNNENAATTLIPATQLQLPAFSVRREKPATLLSSTTFGRANIFLPTHTEPTIRKNGRFGEELSINTTRRNTQPASTISNLPQNSILKQIKISSSNIPHRSLIDYPRHSPTTIEQSSSPTRSSSSSFTDDTDNSSSSGVFTDERQCTQSKDTLSTLEVLSVESIADSQLSLSQSHTRPIIHHYRRPMSVFETIDNKSQNFALRSSRSHSAEGLLIDNQTVLTGKSRQSSAAMERFPTSRSPLNTLEKAGFIRITNHTYRLTADKNDHLYHSLENRMDFYVQYSNYDDSLPPAHDEECYATLPRTSSTEQLDNHLQNDLRLIVDECLRPMITSIGKNRSTKNHRYKRSHLNPDRTQIDVETLTDKLLSSVDYSIYAQYQRCY